MQNRVSKKPAANKKTNNDLTPKGVKEEVIPHYFRSLKTLPKNFSGYAIELIQTEFPLKRNYPLFERFGNVYTHRLENGRYSYCILAEFKKLKRVKIFAEQVIRPSAPKANVFVYKKGVRTKK